MQQRLGKTAWQVKAPDTKADHLSSTPRLTWWEERTDAHKLASELCFPYGTTEAQVHSHMQ